MPSKPLVMYPAEKKLLVDFGERLKLARLRRRFSADTVAQRSGISRMTLYRAERGSPAVSLGVYLRILVVLRLEDDLAALALDDRLGRRPRSGLGHEPWPADTGLHHPPYRSAAGFCCIAEARGHRLVARNFTERLYDAT